MFVPLGDDEVFVFLHDCDTNGIVRQDLEMVMSIEFAGVGGLEAYLRGVGGIRFEHTIVVVVDFLGESE